MEFQYIIAKQSAIRLTQNGILAQLGEHLPYKQRVIRFEPYRSHSFAKRQKNKTWRDSSVG